MSPIAKIIISLLLVLIPLGLALSLYFSNKSNTTTNGTGMDMGTGTCEGIVMPNAITQGFDFSASGSSAYLIVGYAGNNPVITVRRGYLYRFNNLAGASHPLEIQYGTNEYGEKTGSNICCNSFASWPRCGVWGDKNGTQYLNVPLNAPNTLYYQCTLHSPMRGMINVVN